MEVRKFKCINCGQMFETDNPDPLCPNCCSDNITPCKKGASGIALFFAVLGSIAIGFGGVYIYKSMGETEPLAQEQYGTYEPIEQPVRPVQITGEKPVEKIPEKPALSTVPTFITDPVVTVAGEKYNVSIKANTETNDRVRYELCDYNTTTVKYSNFDGEFKNVEAAIDGTDTYTIYAVNTKTNDCVSINVPGFKKIVVAKPIEKLTKEELQEIFNSGNETPELKSKFANKYTLTFYGLPDDEPAPDRYSEIFNRLIAGWLSVEVVSVKYNSMNYITAIEFNVEL